MKKINIFALVIVVVMFLLMLFAAFGDSAVADETAHIPAGYSYVTQFDYRLNPEHPPLIKALSGLFVRAFVRPVFPAGASDEWTQGYQFLYNSGNNADQIIFWARLPVMLLAILTAWLLFSWTRRRFGDATGILALLFFSFSPTVLAHSHYVTTDLGATFGFLLGFICFVKFLEKPSWKNIVLTGLATGAALLTKFSTILLGPLYAIMLLLWAFSRPGRRGKILLQLIFKALVVGVVAFVLVFLVYALFSSHPLDEYINGLLMASNRMSEDSPSYFLGKVSTMGSSWYFPLLYLLKEPLSLHILTVLGVLLMVARFFRNKKKKLKLVSWTRKYFVEISAAIFVMIYFIVSMKSSLNIGVRHVLPTLPFIYILVARMVVPVGGWKKMVVFVLMVWMVLGTIFSAPNFLSYYNVLSGGSKNGYKIALDSNYDWGQDLKRLANFVEKNQIEKINVDYFGGGDPGYYLGNHYQQWWEGRPGESGWFAISANLLYGVHSLVDTKSVQKFEERYAWLKAYKPVVRAGESIFIYHVL